MHALKKTKNLHIFSKNLIYKFIIRLNIIMNRTLNFIYNIFLWSQELNSIDDNLKRLDTIIKDADNTINTANNRKNQFEKDKLDLMNQGRLID